MLTIDLASIEQSVDVLVREEKYNTALKLLISAITSMKKAEDKTPNHRCLLTDIEYLESLKDFVVEKEAQREPMISERINHYNTELASLKETALKLTRAADKKCKKTNWYPVMTTLIIMLTIHPVGYIILAYVANQSVFENWLLSTFQHIDWLWMFGGKTYSFGILPPMTSTCYHFLMISFFIVFGSTLIITTVIDIWKHIKKHIINHKLTNCTDKISEIVKKKDNLLQ